MSDSTVKLISFGFMCLGAILVIVGVAAEMLGEGGGDYFASIFGGNFIAFGLGIRITLELHKNSGGDR